MDTHRGKKKRLPIAPLYDNLEKDNEDVTHDDIMRKINEIIEFINSKYTK